MDFYRKEIMSAITPDTDVILLKVPLEITQENQLTFSNATAQYNYFHNLPRLELEDFTYQRKDGVIRCGILADDLYQYNYVMYRNNGFSNKWFYAFIDKVEYLNHNTSAISIRTDVWQSWQFELDYKPTFVEREHVNDDTIGAHTVPEDLETGEYQIVDMRNSPIFESATPSTDWCYAFCVTEFPNGVTSIVDEGHTIGGVFTSLHFIACVNATAARNLITVYNEDGSTTADAIVNIFVVPRCCVDYNPANAQTMTGHTPTSFSSTSVSAGVYVYPIYDSYTTDSFQLQQPTTLAGDYTPKNKKLYTYPYSYFYLTNKCGTDAVYKWEDFPTETIDSVTAKTLTYKKAIVPSASLSAKLYFTNYKGHAETTDYGTRLYNYGINYAKVPVCAWTTDYYTNWLTQNGVNVGVSIATAALGVGVGIATGGTGLAMGLLTAGSSIANTLSRVYQASVTPDQAQGDVNAGDVMFAYTRNSITFYFMSIRKEMARIIDDYFSMYGYKVNSVKVPNVTGRTNWNYVKTIGCYIKADIPQEDLKEIKDMFNNGVTFWHNPATFADYSQNNAIV